MKHILKIDTFQQTNTGDLFRKVVLFTLGYARFFSNVTFSLTTNPTNMLTIQKGFYPIFCIIEKAAIRFPANQIASDRKSPEKKKLATISPF